MKLSQLINIYEVFNSTADVVWTDDDTRYVGTFTLDDATYRIFLEPGQFKTPELKRSYTFLNIAFSRFEDGKDIFDLTSGGPHASKVLGIIKNAIEQKTKTLTRYGAVIFASTNNQQKRMRVYNKLARFWAKDFGSIQENIKTDSGTELTILMKDPHNTNNQHLIDFLKTQGKI